MPESRVVWAVCTEESGVPPEVVALYESEDEAQRHVAAAYHMVRVKALPVYRTYDELPEDQKDVWEPAPTRFSQARPQEERPETD